MKSITCLAFAVVLMLAFLSVPSYPTPISLGSSDDSGGGGMRSLDWEFTFSCGYVVDEVTPVELLFWHNIGLDYIGATLHITEDMDTDFPFMSSLLTNGINDLLCFGAPGHIYGVYDYELADGNNDFQGYDITSISLTVNDLTFESPGSNPNGDGIWTDYTYDVTFEIWGVPEPSTLFLLGLGAVMLRKRSSK